MSKCTTSQVVLYRASVYNTVVCLMLSICRVQKHKQRVCVYAQATAARDAPFHTYGLTVSTHKTKMLVVSKDAETHGSKL